ncbi:MAG: uncharacterized protein KVP18_001335 [Porospora cf. gigantea A]|uniref:uncharacterized protein n=2 Tax=Porospora cf. gigantea A TaxID=2853593 RepID=UPI003559BE8C|nr:MAG: hypothetical protein KVP18_001335 [Porospora cf. gigantea A]
MNPIVEEALKELRKLVPSTKASPSSDCVDKMIRFLRDKGEAFVPSRPEVSVEILCAGIHETVKALRITAPDFLALTDDPWSRFIANLIWVLCPTMVVRPHRASAKELIWLSTREVCDYKVVDIPLAAGIGSVFRTLVAAMILDPQRWEHLFSYALMAICLEPDDTSAWSLMGNVLEISEEVQLALFCLRYARRMGRHTAPQIALLEQSLLKRGRRHPVKTVDGLVSHPDAGQKYDLDLLRALSRDNVECVRWDQEFLNEVVWPKGCDPDAVTTRIIHDCDVAETMPAGMVNYYNRRGYSLDDFLHRVHYDLDLLKWMQSDLRQAKDVMLERTLQRCASPGWKSISDVSFLDPEVMAGEVHLCYGACDFAELLAQTTEVFTPANPARFVMAPLCQISQYRMMIMRSMLLANAASATVAQVWCSIGWSADVLVEFRLHVLRVMEEYNLWEDMVLQYWLTSKGAPLAPARARWLASRPQMDVACFQTLRERVAYTTYLVTGDVLCVDPVIANVTMFDMPPNVPLAALENVWYMKPVVRRQCTASFADWMDCELAICLVSLGQAVMHKALIIEIVDGSHPKVFAALQGKGIKSASWVDVPDYWNPASLHTVAERICSRHTIYTNLWYSRVFGLSPVDTAAPVSMPPNVFPPRADVLMLNMRMRSMDKSYFQTFCDQHMKGASGKVFIREAFIPKVHTSVLNLLRGVCRYMYVTARECRLLEKDP